MRVSQIVKIINITAANRIKLPGDAIVFHVACALGSWRNIMTNQKGRESVVGRKVNTNK